MKKGFSIVELIAVIAIIGVLSVLIIPTVNTLISNSEEKGYKFQISTIKDSGINFTLENIDVLLSNDKYQAFVIDLKTLKDLAFIDYKIKNPKTNKFFSDDTSIILTKENGTYKAEILDFDSEVVSEDVKYLNHFILIKKDGNNTKEDVMIFNMNGGEYKGEYSVEIENSSTLIEGYNTVIYKVIVDGNQYSIKKFNKI